MRTTDTDRYLLDAPLGSPSRPSWRGRLHLIALWSAIPLLVELAIESDAVRSRAAVIVYAVGLCSMLGVSTTYHRWVHTVRARAIWQRADRANRLGAAMYIAIGWAGLALVPAVWHRGGALAVGLLVAGGVVCTVGAAGFGRRWLTLRPATFSYHEVWHAFTIAKWRPAAAIWTVAT
jgi:hemolysin III